MMKVCKKEYTKFVITKKIIKHETKILKLITT